MVRGLLPLLLCPTLGNWLDDGYNLDKIDHSHKRGTAEHRYYVHQAEKLLGTSGETKIDSAVVADEQTCMERCDQDGRCDCAVFSTQRRTCQRWIGCQRHSNNRVRDSSTNTLMKVPKLTPAYITYNHYGGNSLVVDRGGDPAIVETQQECQDRCTVDPSCDCSVWATDGTTRCWMEKGCNPKDLRYDPLYSTFVKDKSHLVSVETTTTVEQQWVPVVVHDKETTKASTTDMAHATTTESTTTTGTTTTTTTTSGLPDCLLVSMTITMPFPDKLAFAHKGFLEQTPEKAAKGLNADLAQSEVGTSLAGALASAMGVEEGGVHLVGPGWKGVAADDALSVYITAKVNVMDKSLDEYLALRERFCPEAPGTPEMADMSQFLKKLRVNLQQLLSYHPEKRLQHMQALTPALGSPQTRVMTSECTRTEPPRFHLGAALQSGLGAVEDRLGAASRWLHAHSKIMLIAASLLLLILLIRAAMIYGPRGYQKLTGADNRTFRRTLAQRFESRSSRMSRVQSRVEKYAQRTFHLVMAAEPDYEDTELQYYVKVLNGCKGHAKVLCGSPWGAFHTPGECELCKLRIDRPEKGCQCTQGGHRLCWNCMVTIMNWESLAAQEGQHPWTWSVKDWL